MTFPSNNESIIRLVFPPSLSIPSICFHPSAIDLPILGFHSVMVDNADKLSFELTSNTDRISEKAFITIVDSVLKKSGNNKASRIRGFSLFQHDIQNVATGIRMHHIPAKYGDN